MTNDKLIIDECATFMVAATQTTTTLIYTVIYYLTVNPSIKEKVVNEIRSIKNHEDWTQVLTYENLGNLTYLGMCISEALRLDPPVPLSS